MHRGRRRRRRCPPQGCPYWRETSHSRRRGADAPAAPGGFAWPFRPSAASSGHPRISMGSGASRARRSGSWPRLQGNASQRGGRSGITSSAAAISVPGRARTGASGLMSFCACRMWTAMSISLAMAYTLPGHVRSGTRTHRSFLATQVIRGAGLCPTRAASDGLMRIGVHLSCSVTHHVDDSSAGDGAEG